MTFRKELDQAGMLDEEAWQALEAEVADEVEDAVRFADESAEPDPSELTAHVYRDA